VTIADAADCSASLDTVVPRPDGRLRGYFTTTGAPADDVLALESHLPVTDLHLVSEQTDDDDPVCHFEATLGRRAWPRRCSNTAAASARGRRRR